MHLHNTLQTKSNGSDFTKAMRNVTLKIILGLLFSRLNPISLEALAE